MLELSLVTIPANQECTISAFKSLDHEAWPRRAIKMLRWSDLFVNVTGLRKPTSTKLGANA